MNKLISTKNRVFMSMVGPSESGKTQLIYEWLTNGTFQPKFDKIYFFYQYYQSLYDKMQKEIDCIEFVKGVNFELIDSLKNNGTKYLLIFDDSCEEVCSSKEFVKIITAGRHRGLSTIYIKHNLFHKSTLGRDIELQTTQIALFKSPRDVMQINTLSIQLLAELRQYRAEYFAKGLEKCKFLSTLLGKEVENLDDYGCPKILHLNTDWLCTSYPYRHKTILHCAERKAKAFGEWTVQNFNL